MQQHSIETSKINIQGVFLIDMAWKFTVIFCNEKMNQCTEIVRLKLIMHFISPLKSRTELIFCGISSAGLNSFGLPTSTYSISSTSSTTKETFKIIVTLGHLQTKSGSGTSSLRTKRGKSKQNIRNLDDLLMQILIYRDSVLQNNHPGKLRICFQLYRFQPFIARFGEIDKSNLNHSNE